MLQYEAKILQVSDHSVSERVAHPLYDVLVGLSVPSIEIIQLSYCFFTQTGHFGNRKGKYPTCKRALAVTRALTLQDIVHGCVRV